MERQRNHKRYISIILCIYMTTGIMFLAGCSCKRTPGDLLNYSDIGNVSRPGSSKWLLESRELVVTGSGANIWGSQDAFHYLWKQTSGDWGLQAKVQWKGPGANPHRKAGWMIRQDLTEDSPYVDAVLHGDGSASMQFRKTKGGETQEIQSPVKAHAYLYLHRKGDVYTFSVSADGRNFQSAGSVTVALHDPVYVGLAVCSHDENVSETAIFTDIHLYGVQDH